MVTARQDEAEAEAEAEAFSPSVFLCYEFGDVFNLLPARQGKVDK